MRDSRWWRTAVLGVALAASVGCGPAGGPGSKIGEKNNGSNNGGANNGANNGATNNGVANNGTNNGGANNGGANNGAVNNGVSNNGVANNGVANNGILPLQRPKDYVSGRTATTLVFELDQTQEIDARETAKQYVVEELTGLVDKASIEWRTDGRLPAMGASHVWTFDALDQLAKAQNDLVVADGEIAIHVMYLDGRYEKDGVLGVAWGNRHLVMFHDTLQGACNRPLVGADLCRVAESSVLLHEVGHVIGLVDNGAPMVANHEDADHRGHDESDDCVMYWAYEGASVIDVLAGRLTGGSPELTFDPECRADLLALQD